MKKPPERSGGFFLFGHHSFHHLDTTTRPRRHPGQGPQAREPGSIGNLGSDFS
jgi:hypothetical protein